MDWWMAEIKVHCFCCYFLYVCMLVYLSVCFYQSDNVNSEYLHLTFICLSWQANTIVFRRIQSRWKDQDRQMDRQTDQQTVKWIVRQVLKDRSKEWKDITRLLLERSNHCVFKLKWYFGRKFKMSLYWVNMLIQGQNAGSGPFSPLNSNRRPLRSSLLNSAALN